MKSILAATIALFTAFPVAAQTAMPPKGATPFKDTSSFKPPAGAKVAIIEFEDLECPLCAQVSPLVRAAMSRYHIPRVHHDFLIQGHVWSRTGTIYARYLEDKVSPQVAEDFRRDVFASQQAIASQDDLQQFARRWFPSHSQQMPFLLDPTGRCAAEVQADCALGMRVGIGHTPTIVVATSREWIEVTDAAKLDAAIERAEADATPSARSRIRR